MAFRSGFYDAQLIDGQYVPSYNAADFAEKFKLYFTNGIFYENSTVLQVSATGGRGVGVAAGSANVNGYTTYNDAQVSHTLTSADPFNPRYDRVVLRLDILNKTFTTAVRIGTPSASPSIPDVSGLTRTDSVYELLLAYVLVRAGATTIYQSDITDCRGDSQLCGFVTGTVSQLDTSSFWQQWQTRFSQYATQQENDFTTWWNGIRATLESIDLTQLMERQDTVEDKLDQIIQQDYYTTGSNDNAKLVTLVNNFLDDSSIIGGTLVVNVIGSTWTAGTARMVFADATISDINKRVILDFSRAGIVEIRGGITGKFITFRNLRLVCRIANTAIIGTDCSFEDCEIVSDNTSSVNCIGIDGSRNTIINSKIRTVSTSGATCLSGNNITAIGCAIDAIAGTTAKGVDADGTFVSCDVVATSNSTVGLGYTRGAFAYYNDNGLMRILGGSARAYVLTTTIIVSNNFSECVGLYQVASNLENVMIVSGLNLPNVVRSGYASYNSLSATAQDRYKTSKINSGKFLFTGITAFKELSKYTSLPNWELAAQFIITAVSSAVGSTTAVNNANSFVNTIKNGYTGDTIELGTVIINKTAGLT